MSVTSGILVDANNNAVHLYQLHPYQLHILCYCVNQRIEREMRGTFHQLLNLWDLSNISDISKQTTNSECTTQSCVVKCTQILYSFTIYLSAWATTGCRAITALRWFSYCKTPARKMQKHHWNVHEHIYMYNVPQKLYSTFISMAMHGLHSGYLCCTWDIGTWFRLC